MKKALSVLAVALLVAGISFKISQDPFFARYGASRDAKVSSGVTSASQNTPGSLVAPTVANDFFSALCARDAAYLAANTGGSLASTEEDLTEYFASLTTQCFGVRYLGSLTPTPGTTQFVFVMDYGPDGELWFVLDVTDGVPVSLQ